MGWENGSREGKEMGECHVERALAGTETTQGNTTLEEKKAMEEGWKGHSWELDEVRVKAAK